MKQKILALWILLATQVKAQRYLDGVGTEFRLISQDIFLSGMNIAWHNFGRDFGNGQYDGTGTTLEEYLRRIHINGGNSVRM